MESFGLFPLRSIKVFQHICCTSVFNGSWRFWINPLVTESNMIEISLNCKPCGDTLNITLFIYRLIKGMCMIVNIFVEYILGMK